MLLERTFNDVKTNFLNETVMNVTQAHLELT